MTTSTIKLHVFIALSFILSAVAQANDMENNDTTHLGHDYSRQLMANKAKLSSEMVEKTYTTLLSRIKASTFPGDKEHISETAHYLAREHKLWKSYRESHCGLTSNVYVYPSDSRMWASQYHSCQFDMNEKRIKFLNGIGYEFK